MNKPFLLIAGQGYYPNSGTDDWIGCFASQEEAMSKIQEVIKDEVYKSGPRKGQVKLSLRKKIVEKPSYGPLEIDWYDVVDLREWVN